MIHKIVRKIKNKITKYTTQKYITSLQKRGIKIGENLKIFDIKSITIDTTRPSLITIGNNVFFHKNFTLYTHDFVSGVFLNKYHDFLPSSGKVSIGNNVRFGINCTVLKGVTIGDNCFIAAGSIVTKDIPANSIAGGVPAKVFCSLEAYYEKRKRLCVEEAFEYAQSIRERFNREPIPEDFCEECVLFVDSTNIDKYKSIPIHQRLENHYEQWIKQHNRQFKNFNDFITASKEFKKTNYLIRKHNNSNSITLDNI